MFPEDYLYILALRQCKNIGIANLKKLIRHLGSARSVWEISKKELLSISGIGTITIADIGKKEFILSAEKELTFCENHKIKIIDQQNEFYPKYLLNCEDSPILLFYKGNLNPQLNPLSVVGTRNLTSYGKNFIQDLMKNLMGNNIVSISGLALGADSCVHEESLKNQIPTIAVLAQSLNTIYPSVNKKLSEKILENDGALITEYANFDGSSKEYFLQRNRIIAGFSPNLIVAETAFGGGSVTTVNYANQYNREVFALPGKITDKYSQGCNLLISLNKAESIVDVKTLIKHLNYQSPELFPKKVTKIKLSEDKKEHQLILDIIGKNKITSLDEIAEKSDILHHKLLPILLDLEIYGYVKCLSGKQYQLES